ncbi:fanconi-associated nuclease 1-like [Saccostrea echinata]|uniref:fanconi-associated nuclease 1-like n=1 Tax=Saccostrea echinata TaxID=191078 RepID=UPI002A7F023F|nr:fanconi-associated nuclease 1-like [Saccostrea echinata]
MKEKLMNKKGKTPQKKKEQGFQTITSMFKKQKQQLANEVSKSEVISISGTNSKEEDEDIQITYVETTSEYFLSKERTSKSVKRLSLRKSRVKEDNKTLDSTSESTLGSNADLNETGPFSTDQIHSKIKENNRTGCEKSEKTVKVEPQVSLSSSNTEVNSKKKLSLRKRKSECPSKETSLIEKRLKTDDEKHDSISIIRRNKSVPNVSSPNSRRTKTKENNVETDEAHSINSGTSTPLPKDNSSSNSDLPEDEENVIQTPYYLENFRTIISTILSCEDDLNLFNDEDRKFVSIFGELTEPAQKLYVRLFGRKWKWLTQQQIKYPGIKDDLSNVFQELKREGFLSSENDLDDLEKALNLLSAPDLKSFAKTYHISSITNKKAIIPALLKKCKENTIGSMFKVPGLDPYQVMLKRVKKQLGPCVCLCEEPRFVFVRMLMLFSLSDTILDDDNANAGQSQLFRMLQVNIGDTVYPTFTVSRETKIFKDRESVLRFSKACLLEADLWSRLERNEFEAAYSVYLEAKERVEDLKKDNAIANHDKTLPHFLRPFTAFSVYTRIINQGVELLQRRKEYTGAVSVLRKLLSQQVYCTDYRGHWWERLALNYDAHLKNQEKALEAVASGLRDKSVTAGRRLALYQRAEKICNAPKSKFKDRLKKLPDEGVKATPEVCIEGTVLSDNMPGMRYKFIMADPDGDEDKLTFCGVEELVMEHYKNNGYPEGLHAEGSILSNLFALFFWDILFMDVPDAFHSTYQTHPLDLYTTQFYTNRQSAIDQQLEKIKNAEVEELHSMMTSVWENHFGVMCTGLNWERFLCLGHAQGLVSCMGGRTLSQMLERFVKNPRHTRSGFPDLTLWNPQTGALKICEVKGPNDRLSHKQILWIDYLVSLGVDAEVCYVKAVGSKRLKTST